MNWVSSAAADFRKLAAEKKWILTVSPTWRWSFSAAMKLAVASRTANGCAARPSSIVKRSNVVPSAFPAAATGNTSPGPMSRPSGVRPANSRLALASAVSATSGRRPTFVRSTPPTSEKSLRPGTSTSIGCPAETKSG